MGSVHNEGGAYEVKRSMKNDEEVQKLENSVGKSEEIPPLDVKDYEELELLIDLEELGETSYENANIDFNAMFADFFPEDQEKEIFGSPVVLPTTHDPSLLELERWMDIDPPELRLGGGGPSLSADPNNWDFELMEWLWYPNSYQEFLRFYQG